MNWGASDILLGLWALPILGVLLYWALVRRRQALSKLGPIIREGVGVRANSRHRSRLWLMWLGVALVLVSLAQPRWGFRWQELEREGLSVVVVLDTSSSMASEDVSPSRMERAQREILDLTQMLGGDRIGLVIFAGGAYPRMPLTLDYGALRTVVRRTGVKTLRSQGSDIGAALEAAGKLLGPAGSADRAILLISDGEDQVGHAESVAGTLAEDGVHIYAMGVGTTDGGPIPTAQGGFKKGADGNMVLSRLDESTLKRLASIGNGAYVRSTSGTADIQAIYEGEIRGKLQRANQGVRRDKIWDERFQWPLGLGLGLLLVGFLVRGPRVRGSQVAAMVALLIVAPQVHSDEGEVARLATQQVANPDDLSVAEALGSALFQDGQYNRAEEVLSSVADRATDAQMRDRARFNAGLSAYNAGRLTEAVEDWQRLLQDGENPAAQKNIDAVQKELAARTGEEPPEQDCENSEDGEQGEQGDQEQDQKDPPEKGGDTGASEPPKDDPSSENKEEEPPADDGTRPPQGGDTSAPPEPVGDRGEITENEPSEARDTGAQPEPVKPVGAISAQEAQRMFDGVEEGAPRVVVDPGSAGGNDW